MAWFLVLACVFLVRKIQWAALLQMETHCRSKKPVENSQDRSWQRGYGSSDKHSFQPWGRKEWRREAQYQTLGWTGYNNCGALQVPLQNTEICGCRVNGFTKTTCKNAICSDKIVISAEAYRWCCQDLASTAWIHQPNLPCVTTATVWQWLYHGTLRTSIQMPQPVWLLLLDR